MNARYPIRELIETQMKQIGLGRGGLALRCGFKNVAKGLRRIDVLCDGDINSKRATMVIDALPAALEIDKSKVDAALQETAKLIEEAEQRAVSAREAAWRASFVPCGYLLGTNTRPSQITFFGLTGGVERWLRIPLDTSQPPVTFAAQALAVVKETPTVPFFGPTTGFIVNYTPDRAVRFDLRGVLVQQFDRAYEPGQVTILIGGRKLSAGLTAKLFGQVDFEATGVESDASSE
jgi:hypothetical protein